MTGTSEVQKEDTPFEKFCKLACPSYLTKAPSTIKDVTRNLEHVCDINELLEQAKEFKAKFPEGIKLEEGESDVISKKKNSFDYRRKASDLIKEKTGMVLHPSSVVPFPFYRGIIDHCIKK